MCNEILTIIGVVTIILLCIALVFWLGWVIDRCARVVGLDKRVRDISLRLELLCDLTKKRKKK